ncbi:MAG: hypothetical protein LYZ70_04705 [Nitrososphaerales archaeon]|nr:hypothetical protein [Nitrososphaerales archaeon]
MPEVWIPYGEVETLVSLQAENSGTVVDPQPEKSSSETERLTEKVRRATGLFVCDTAPTTMELLRELIPATPSTDNPKVYGQNPKKVELALPQLKGRVDRAVPPAGGAQFGEHLTSEGEKLFVGSARPDPFFGMVDARVSACLNWVAGSAEAASQGRKDMEPTPFERTGAYEAIDELASKIPDASFVTVIPRSGKVRSALEDAPFDAIKNGFFSTSVVPTKALIVGAGGSGYDDTLSSALRSLWGALPCVRKAGVIMLLAECSEGLGSRALEMMVTGRIGGEGDKRREKHVPGLEEVHYLRQLKEDYSVLLLSGLPELYAKSKLGFTTAKGSGEALGRLLSRAGRTSKVNVVTRAAECRISSA